MASADTGIQTATAALRGLWCAGGLVSLFALCLSGCSAPQPARAPAHGEAGVELLAPPTTVARYALQAGQVAIPPVLRHQVLPVYPAELVTRAAPTVTIKARLVLDAQGRVVSVQASESAGAPARHARFVAAVEKAARQWRFLPFRVRTSQADGTVRQTPRPISLWYAFHFRVVAGKPQVDAQGLP